jgi:hypothetical protein
VWSWEKLIWLISHRWLTVLGLATGVILLVSVGSIPWIEVVLPAWVFVFSVDTLVASFRRADPLVLTRLQ